MDYTTQRGNQLRAKGESPDFIHRLAEDAGAMANLHIALKRQVITAKQFAQEIGRYHEHYDPDELLDVVNDFADNVSHRIRQLDQTVRDLLQFVSTTAIISSKLVGADLVQEFAWVSINEAHRSTSIATSMKRLSWITVRICLTHHMLDRS